MGYGKNLQKALKVRRMSIGELSRLTGISANDIATLIWEDKPVGFYDAVRISSLLHIPLCSITSGITAAEAKKAEPGGKNRNTSSIDNTDRNASTLVENLERLCLLNINVSIQCLTSLLLNDSL